MTHYATLAGLATVLLACRWLVHQPETPTLGRWFARAASGCASAAGLWLPLNNVVAGELNLKMTSLGGSSFLSWSGTTYVSVGLLVLVLAIGVSGVDEHIRDFLRRRIYEEEVK